MMMMNGYVKPQHNKKKRDSSLFLFMDACGQEVPLTAMTRFFLLRFLSK
jgi:hypothetical protein